MTDGDALLRAILEDPADDTLRLVYADWLEEQGGQPERADFVRAQIALDEVMRSLPADHHSVGPLATVCLKRSCRPCSLRCREKKLLRHHGCDWRGEAYRIIAEVQIAESLATGRPVPKPWLTRDGRITGVWSFEYRHGLIGEVRCDCADWLKHGAALAAAHPVTEVRLTDKQPNRTHTEQDGRPVWCWWKDGNGPGPQSRLPAPLWEPLTPPAKSYPLPWRHITVHDEPSEDEALAALSRAAVAWARERAGLPPLHAARQPVH